MLLHSDHIQAAMDEKLIMIDGFSKEALHPASYNFRLGDEVITSNQREKADPSRRGLLIIAAGDFALA